MSNHTDETRYLVCVLFCHGLAELKIARMLRHHRVAYLTKGQVSGIVNRAGDGALRNLDKAGRQSWLDRMKEDRMDTGRLKPEHFIARDRH